jgi:hypothetical protein
MTATRSLCGPSCSSKYLPAPERHTNRLHVSRAHLPAESVPSRQSLLAFDAEAAAAPFLHGHGSHITRRSYPRNATHALQNLVIEGRSLRKLAVLLSR